MCSCGKNKAGKRAMVGPQRGLVSNLAKSRQLPAPALRQFAQTQIAQQANIRAQDNTKKIRQRSIRQKFGHP